MSLKSIMSQFGYAEEQSRNKARAWYLGFFSPPPIPPGFQPPPLHVCNCVLWEHCWAHVAESLIFVIHKQTHEKRQHKKWVWWKKGNHGCSFFFFFIIGWWMGLILSLAAPHSSCWSLALTAHSCFHRPFRLQSNITGRDQSPINQML